MKNAKSRKGILKNKKGFTFIEAIAVVAIMGILATVIGSLLTSATTAYMRQKEQASAKDISSIVAGEIKRSMKKADTIFLQSANNGKLPGIQFTADEKLYDKIQNVPFNNGVIANKAFFSYDGILMYKDKGDTLDAVTNLGGISYFTETESEQRAFYGSFVIDVYFRAINTAGKYLSIKVYVDVYKNSIEAKNLKYEAPGTPILFQQSDVAEDSIVFNYSTTADAVQMTAGNWYYKNMIDDTTKYTHLYYSEAA